MDDRNLTSSDDWRVIGASVIGSSHEVSETRCQDAHRVSFVTGPAGDTAIVTVADGAGSARYSHIGAVTATATAVQLIADHLSESATLDKADLVRMLHPVRQAVSDEAQERAGDAHDFASTLLVIVAMPDRTLAAHIGDGAIVVDDGVLRVLSWPEQGEYANMTVFLTTQNAVEQARVYETGPISSFAVFSDGLQNVALDYAAQDVFAPFIETMLKPLKHREADSASLEIALTAYLGSDAINKRTDDDKTLVLGVRTAP